MSKKKARKKTAAEKRSYAQKSLANNVEKRMKRYLNDLNGHSPNQLYDFFLQEVEKPFFDVVMQTNGFPKESFPNSPFAWMETRKYTKNR